MLYVTTRSKMDAETVSKALSSDRGQDGGWYIPMQMPAFFQEQLADLTNKPFWEVVAEILNLFFSCRLTAEDLDLSLGQNCIGFTQMSHRIVVAEAWRNVERDYAYIQQQLAWKVCDSLGCSRRLTSWLRIAVRLSLLFGVFAQLTQTGVLTQGQVVDISVAAEDFSAVMSFWYGRMMGLPIGKIICSCNENSGAWDLLHLGELHTNTSVTHTSTPLCDLAFPLELERLIHGAVGCEEASVFAKRAADGLLYRPEEQTAAAIRKGMFAAVVSRSRMDALIPSVYRTNSYILGTYTALAYGGLMDYRAKTGESGPAMIWAERSPDCDREVVAEAMQVSVQELFHKLNKM